MGKLTWPNSNEDVTMEWSQTSNPLVEDVVGYEPIDVPYTGRGWGGLEPSTNGLMDGSVLGTFKSNWFYAVGAYAKWPTGSNTLPAYAKADNDNSYAQTQVELYVQKKQETSHFTTCGRPNRCSSGTQSAMDDEVRAVRCVSDQPISGWTNALVESGCADRWQSLWFESDVWGECKTLNFDDATAFCASMNARLPTLSEAEDGCVASSGCNFDLESIWTSTPTHATRRQMEAKEFSTLKNRLLYLQN